MTAPRLAAVPSDRTPPHSVEAERATLGAILVAPKLFQEVRAVLSTDDFFLPAHRDIWDAFVAVDATERPIDAILVATHLRARGQMARLEGGESYLLAIANETPALSNVRHYADIVSDKAIARRLIATCMDVVSRAYTGEVDASDLVDEHAGALLKIANRSSADLVTIRSVVDEMPEIFDQRQKSGNPITGVRTGIDKLDRYTGGFQPEHVVVVAARPGVGKTAFAMDVALRHVIRDGGTCLFFSLEMSRHELVERMYACQGGVDSHHLKRGEISMVAWSDINRAREQLAPAAIYIVDDQTTMSQIEATSRRYAARHPDKKGLVIIDYVQLIDVGGKIENQRQALGDVSRRVKRLAKALQMPIIEVAQLNRDSDKERRAPRMSDLRDSGALEQDASIIIFPDDFQARREPGLGEPPPEKTVDGDIDLILAKNRNGIAGIIRARWVAKFYTYFDSDSRQTTFEPEGDTR